MFEPIKISPSILSADFMNMERDIKMIGDAGAQWVHVDVMDGHFVPNLTMGVPVVKQLKKITEMPLDVHLMISNPEVQIPWFLQAGSDIVTFHIETVDMQTAKDLMAQIHDAGAKAGIAVKPKTPISQIEELIPLVDMVLVMSVEPGFSGQSYIEGSEDKVAEVASIAESCADERMHAGLEAAPLIQVDGGIGNATCARVAANGADVLVCGNAVFAAEDPAAAVESVKGLADEARLSALSAQSH